MLRYLIVLPACLALGGCFFFWVPLKGEGPGNTCVHEPTYIGEIIQNQQTGKKGPVTAIYGRSERCRSESQPILADVDYKD